MGRVRSVGAFTLMEILVVVVIISLLAGLITGAIFSHLRESQIRLARTQTETLEDSVKAFRLDVGRLPSAAEGLRALIPPGPGNAPRYNADGYIDDAEEGLPPDPWNNPYHYETDGKTFMVISYGPDGVASEDDITSRSPRR